MENSRRIQTFSRNDVSKLSIGWASKANRTVTVQPTSTYRAWRQHNVCTQKQLPW